MSDSQEARAPRGLAGDIYRAREGTKASAAELREFVREFRGRTPQEMLGLVAGSNLIQATTVATVITVALMALFTVGPYLYNKSNPAAPQPKEPVAAAPKATASSTAPAAGATATGAAGTAAAPLPAAVATGTGPAQPDVLNTLGIGETKISDPKKNPLESGADDLLKDLK